MLEYLEDKFGIEALNGKPGELQRLEKEISVL
jgi:hypothetical protein